MEIVDISQVRLLMHDVSYQYKDTYVMLRTNERLKSLPHSFINKFFIPKKKYLVQRLSLSNVSIIIWTEIITFFGKWKNRKKNKITVK